MAKKVRPIVSKKKDRSMSLAESVKPVEKSKTNSFDQTHVRVTTYLTRENRDTLEELKDGKQIKSFARVINVALKHFLEEHL